MKRPSLSTVFSLVLALVLCLALPTFADDVPDGFSEVVVFAEEQARFDNDFDRVNSGHVVVNDVAPDEDDDDDAAEGDDEVVELWIGKNSTIAGSFSVGIKGSSITSFVVGDQVRVRNGATVEGDAYYNELQLDNGGAILGVETTPVALPFFDKLPAFRTGAPGTADVDVAPGTTQTLPAGDYDEVEVHNGATLILSGGVYNVRSFEAGNYASVLVEAGAEVRVEENFRLGREGLVGSAPGAGVPASRIAFFVNGTGDDDDDDLQRSGSATTDDDDDDGDAVEIHKDGTVAGTYYAPNGRIRIHKNVVGTGAFVARKVSVAKDVVLGLDSFFNEAPEPQDDSASTLEGGTVTVLDGGATSVLDNDDDPNSGDTLTAHLVTPPAHAAAFNLNADGTFAYTHDSSENHLDVFVYEACDDGNPVLCTSANVVITMIPVNDAPTLDPIADVGILEDAGEQIVNLSGISQGGGGETLPAPQLPLTVTATSDNPGLILDPMVIYTSPDATGSLAYEPMANQSGSAVITVTVMDAGGTANGGVDTTQQTFTVTVTAVNDAPTLDPIADPAAILEDAGQQVVNFGGITQGGGGETVPAPQFPLAVTAASDNPGLIPNPKVTYASPGAAGSLAYTPVADQSGTAIITVTVTDSGGTANGGSDTTQQSFTVAVTAVNDAPTLDPIPDPAPIFENSPEQTVNLSGISQGGGGETDPEQFPLVVTASSSNPVVVPDPTVTYASPDAAGSLSYTPAADHSGSVVITVTLADAGGTGNGGVDSVQQTFTVEITDEAPNNPPAIQADNIRVDPGGTATSLFPSGNSVLDNDSDPNGDNIILTTPQQSGPSHGSLTLAGDGTFSYTHSNDGSTSDQFVYEACDDGSPVECATATVFIDVVASTMDVTVTVGSGDGSGGVISSPSGIDCGSDCSETFTTATDLPIDLFATADAGSLFAGWTGSSDCLDGRLTVAADASCNAVFSISAPPAGDPFDVTILLAGTGGGTVGSDPAGISCPGDCFETFQDVRVALTATPDGSSSFVGFSGTGDCVDGLIDGTVHVSCIATFEALPPTEHTLTVLFPGDGVGDVTSHDFRIACQSDCSAEYADGETVILNARPQAGSTFVGYSGDCGTVSGFEAVIFMDADTECTATFDSPN